MIYQLIIDFKKRLCFSLFTGSAVSLATRVQLVQGEARLLFAVQRKALSLRISRNVRVQAQPRNAKHNRRWRVWLAIGRPRRL